MKIVQSTALLLAATALGATAAAAQSNMGQSQGMAPQTAAPTTEQQMPQTATPDASASTSAQATAESKPLTNADVTDSDVNQFATAVLAVQKVQGDATVAANDKQPKMAAAVEQSGLTPQKFNAIAQASQSDPALMKRIQTAAAAQAGGSASASGGTSGTN